MKNLDLFNTSRDLVVDSLKKSKEGSFSTKRAGSDKEEVSDVRVKFINKKPIPLIEFSFKNVDDFYKHRINLYRGSSSSQRIGQLFDLKIFGRGCAIVTDGVIQFKEDKQMLVMVYEIEFIEQSTGRKQPFIFLKRD